MGATRFCFSRSSLFSLFAATTPHIWMMKRNMGISGSMRSEGDGEAQHYCDSLASETPLPLYDYDVSTLTSTVASTMGMLHAHSVTYHILLSSSTLIILLSSVFCVHSHWRTLCRLLCQCPRARFSSRVSYLFSATQQNRIFYTTHQCTRVVV